MAPSFGLDPALVRKLTSHMGGGMFLGETCGAVNAARMLLAARYGYQEENDGEQKQVLMEKLAHFQEKFLERYPGTLCRELLGRKVPEEMAQIVEEGTMLTKCPLICLGVIEILEEMIEEET